MESIRHKYANRYPFCCVLNHEVLYSDPWSNNRTIGPITPTKSLTNTIFQMELKGL